MSDLAPPEEADRDHHLIEEIEEHANWIPIVAALLGAVLIVAVVLLVHPLRSAVTDALSGDTAALRSDLRGLGIGGVVLVLALAVSHAVIWYPAEILNAAVGFVYGFWAGLALVMAGWLLNGLVCHQIGRHAARPALIRMLGDERFRRYERIVERGGVMLLLGCRMVPIVPFSLFSYVAGSARVPLGTFMWTTAVGYLPLTALFVYLGSKLEELSLNDPAIWIGAAGLIFFALVTRKLLPLLNGQRKHPSNDWPRPTEADGRSPEDPVGVIPRGWPRPRRRPPCRPRGPRRRRRRRG